MPVRLCIGDVVLVDMKQEDIGIGVIKYIGFIEGFEMTESYVGLELVECISNGHSGIINGIQYFTCRNGHGIHTRITNVIRKLQASEVTTKMKEVIILFKQRMGEYVQALSDRDEYIQQLKNQQHNLRRLFKQHCTDTNINIDSVANISPKINIIQSPSFSFLNSPNLQKHNFGIATFKVTKMQLTESEGDISIASMQTDLTNTKRDSSIIKLNTIDETLTAKIDLDPNTLVKGLDILSNPMTPVTPITPAESLQSDSEILHATKISPDLSSLNKGKKIPTKLLLKTRFKKQEFPDTEKITNDYHQFERSKRRRKQGNKNKMHRRSSSEQNVHNQNNHEYTKYVTRNRNRNMKNKSKSRRNVNAHKLHPKRSVETEDTQSVSSYESSYDSNYHEQFEEYSNYNEETTEWSDYCSTSSDEQYNHHNAIYSSRSTSKKSKHKNIHKYKRKHKHKHKHKNKNMLGHNMKQIGLKNQSNSEQQFIRNRYFQYNNNIQIHHNANSMNSALPTIPDNVYIHQTQMSHPTYQMNGINHNSQHNSPSMPENPQLHGQFSMSAGNLRQLGIVNQASQPLPNRNNDNNSHVHTHKQHSSNHAKKVSQKRQVKFVRPVLELRNVNTCSGGPSGKMKTNKKPRLKKDNHRRSTTWDPSAGGGLLPQHEFAVVQPQQQQQQQQRHHQHVHHQVQYSNPNSGNAYYPQPAIDDWMQHQMQQQHKGYFHHN